MASVTASLRGSLPMLGPPKSRHLDQPIAGSLEALVPQDNFSRHLEAILDLSFVRVWVRNRSAERGRPGIDPMVFFKTDPDATPMATGSGTVLGDHDHHVVDGGKARIILAARITPADVMENVPMRDLLWRVCFRRKLRPHHVTGDTTDGTGENIVAIEGAGIRA